MSPRFICGNFFATDYCMTSVRIQVQYQASCVPSDCQPFWMYACLYVLYGYFCFIAEVLTILEAKLEIAFYLILIGACTEDCVSSERPSQIKNN